MPFAPTPGAAKCLLQFRLDGQIVQTSLDVGVETETEANMLTAAEGLAGSFETHIMPHLSEDLLLESAVAFGLSSLDAPIGVFIPGTLITGGTAAMSLPNNVAYCLTKRTGVRGRSFRGRMYLPGIPSTQVDAPSRLASSYVASIVAGAAGLLADMITGGFPPVVVSWMNNGAQRVTGVATPITSLAPSDNVLDSQRRRLPGRGS